ncbi:hypothetical protein [Salinispora arenicola]|uniref:hypothetical protein n=1 Tax=Salinispora arenicola TaxID=168697 RepID=UPI00035E3CA4|nr:hypothetical protein [Salinispora arenicola]
MSSAHSYAIGDRVIVDPAIASARHRGVIYRVTRLLPVNVVVEPDGGGRTMRINPSYLRPAPDANNTNTGATAAVTGVERVPYETPLDQGTLVTVAGPGWKQPAGELYVVLRDNGTGKVSLVKLGGNNGRYWRGVSRRLVTVVDPARLRLDPIPAT